MRKAITLICYRDMTFCSAKCANAACPRQFTEEHRQKAAAWWGAPGLIPVAYADYSPTCPDYQPIPAPEAEPARE